jgi:protein TonB
MRRTIQPRTRSLPRRETPGHITPIQWSGRVTQELETGLRYPEVPSYEVPPDGVVEVKFRCSDSGASDQVSVFKTSGSHTLDRAAVRALKRLKQLHPLATGTNPNQNYIAMVLFATSRAGHAKQLVMINSDARKRNAWFKGRSQTASAGIILAPVSN